ncbi:MAG TPA: DUF3108 domain-containing protein [Bacteroidales bacterium]|nr:DUF3108 domain-containing protein [Bacteroidales bacterium]
MKWSMRFICLSLLFSVQLLMAQESTKISAFKDGETLKYLVHYGFIDGGYAMLKLTDFEMNGKKYFHAVASGYSTGLADKLFKVRDVYETFVDKETDLPLKAIRNISEDTYKYYDEVLFNRKDNTIISKRKGKVSVPENTMDILSAVYYARNNNFKNIKQGDIITLDTYFDDGMFTLQIRFKGTETIKTEFGKVNCLKFSPVVEPGRIFDTQDDVTIWISNDHNYIPVRIQFDLFVGSVKADLVKFENLKYNFAVSKK